MQIRKICFRSSIIVALAVWVVISLSILTEVIESRKNTIAARSTGYIQQDVKAGLTTSHIVASEPSIPVKVFFSF